MGAYVDNLGKGGGESKGSRNVFQDIDAGVTNFWVGDVRNEPPRGPGPGGGSTHGSSTDHWEASPEVIGQGLGVSTSGDSDTGGRF